MFKAAKLGQKISVPLSLMIRLSRSISKSLLPAFYQQGGHYIDTLIRPTPLFSVCVPTPDINYHRNVKVVFEVLISDFFTLRSEHEMLRKVPKIKDFYEVFFCINTTVSTWNRGNRNVRQMLLVVNGNISTAFLTNRIFEETYQP